MRSRAFLVNESSSLQPVVMCIIVMLFWEMLTVPLLRYENLLCNFYEIYSKKHHAVLLLKCSTYF